MRRIFHRDFELEESVKGIYITALNGTGRLMAYNIGLWFDMKGTAILWRDDDLDSAKQRIDNMYRTYENDWYTDYDDSLLEYA